MSEFILFKGQKRNGNHLIINWFMSICNNICFKNDCMYNSLDNTVNKENIIKTLKNLEENYDFYIISIEALELLKKSDIKEIINFAESIPKLKIKKSLSPVILRDPINWYASYIKKNNQEIEPLMIEWVSKNYKKIWEIYRAGLYHYKISDFKINYNKFVENLNYRKEICNKFDKEFNEEKDANAINTLWQPQGVYPASSFDNYEIFNGEKNAISMKVMERYRSIIKVFNYYPVPSDIIKDTKDLWSELPIERINKRFKPF